MQRVKETVPLMCLSGAHAGSIVDYPSGTVVENLLATGFARYPTAEEMAAHRPYLYEDADAVEAAQVRTSEPAPEENAPQEPSEDLHSATPDAEEGEGKAEAAVDLREVSVKALDDALAEIDDADLVRTMLEADDRKTAAPKYEARLEELGG